MIEHLDEAGRPCTRHAPVERAAVLALAVVGSRAPSFHHDCASKLQSLVLALDELGELTEPPNEHVRRALDTANVAVRDLLALLNVNRALTKPGSRTKVSLGDLVAEAAARTGTLVRGTIGTHDVEVTAVTTTHALAVLVDLCAGTESYKRMIHVAAEVRGGRVTLTLTDRSGRVAANASELIALAAFIFAGDGGELRCDPTGFVVQFPVNRG